MIELTADRLVLVETAPRPNMPAASTIISTSCSGGVRLRRRSPSSNGMTARPRRKRAKMRRALKKAAAEAEAASARLAAQCSALDRAHVRSRERTRRVREHADERAQQRRAEVASELKAAEARWLEANEQLESSPPELVSELMVSGQVRTRLSICAKKKAYQTEENALDAARSLGLELRTYRCDRCGLIHLTSRTKGKRTPRPIGDALKLKT